MPAAAAPREKTFLLARPEARVLEWIARRLPHSVKPDHLTLLGILAALGIAAAYVLSNGDSALAVGGERPARRALAGRLARRDARARPQDRAPDLRLLPRPPGRRDRHRVIGIGLGLSPHLLLATGMVLVIVYLVLSINTYLETQALGVFRLGYGRLGPTEARIGLIVLNTLLALGVPMGFELAGLGLSVLDVVVLGAAAAMTAGLAIRAAATLRILAAREPARRSRPGTAGRRRCRTREQARRRPARAPGTSTGTTRP